MTCLMDITRTIFLLTFYVGLLSCQKNNKSSMQTSSSLPKGISVWPVQLFPAKQDHFNLTLEYSGPSVLDSSVTFRVNLSQMNNSNVLDSSLNQFVFQWVNMANGLKNETIGSFASELTLSFTSDRVSSGEYTMTVGAFPVNDTAKMIAFKTIKFVLTEMLNGNLTLTQSLVYQTKPMTFATNKPLTAVLNLNDIFSTRTKTHFIWFKDGQNISDVAVLTHNFTQVGDFTLMLLLGLNFMEASNNLVTHYKNDVLERDRREPLKQNDVADCNFSKCGYFQQFLTLKDELHTCQVTRIGFEDWNRRIALDSLTEFNVTCLGSSPSGICLNVTTLNYSIPSSSICSPKVFLKTTHHVLSTHLSSRGWLDVHFFLYNDVSQIHLVESYIIYDADNINLPTLIFPTIFGLLGIIIIIIGVVHLLKLQKKPFVEVADFDFHPSIAEKQSVLKEKLFTVLTNFKSALTRQFTSKKLTTAHNFDSESYESL